MLVRAREPCLGAQERRVSGQARVYHASEVDLVLIVIFYFCGGMFGVSSCGINLDSKLVGDY